MASIVHTSTGPVRGFLDTHHLSEKSTHALAKGEEKPVQKYLGLPYGRAERWQQSEQVVAWTEVLDCLEFGPSPPTTPGFLSGLADIEGYYTREHVGESESDLFTLNIFASDGVKKGDQVPVMVWIYGGSWRDGTSALGLYDATDMVRRSKKPLICVTVNYRTNVLGFLASEDLRDDNGLVGNYGLRDQLLALKWVKRNIAEWGGSTSNVTIFGESAGAASVGYHIGGIDPVFSKAILQSGAASTMGFQPVEQHEKLWHNLLKFCEVDRNDPERVAKMRAVPLEQLMDFIAQNPGVRFNACQERGPYSIWDIHPDLRIANGEFIESLQSVVLGVCRDEGTMFADFFGATKSQTIIDRLLDAFGPAGKRLRVAYPGIERSVEIAEEQPDLRSHPAARFLHDSIFAGPVNFLANTLRDRPHRYTGKTVDVYMFRSETLLPALVMPHWGIYHTAEIPLVFNTSSLWQNDPTRQEQRWADQYGEAWRRFAASGRPALATDWPKFNGSNKLKVLKESSQFLDDFYEHDGLLIMDEVIRGRWGIQAKRGRPKL